MNHNVLLYRDRFIYAFSFVGISSTLIFGVFQHLRAGNNLTALFELFLCTVALLNVLYYRYKKDYDLASRVILVIMVITLSFLVATGGLKGTGIYWIYTFPLLAFFMKPLKEALLWNLALMGSFLLLFLLGKGGLINFFYSWESLRQAMGAYIAVLMLSAFYSFILTKLMKSLEVKATVDTLTGLHNRAFVFEMLTNLLNIAKREDSVRYCLAYLDLDNFKRVNDLYGHEEGDKVLKEVARIIRGNFRSGDVVGRIGGDEFIVIVYNCNEEALIRRLERVKTTIEQLFKKYGLSLSYGIVSIPKEGTEVNIVLKLADDRMYEMKRSKRG